jgi:Na+-translocating ferredoxin:NAD+ oxidoreductase RnfE subunit
LFQGLALVFDPQIFGITDADLVIRFNFDGLLLVILPPGAFLTFGCLLAAKNWLMQHE